MYGPYLAKLKNDSKPEVEALRWFSCLSCEVQWKDLDKKSKCFCCGKWGKRAREFFGF